MFCVFLKRTALGQALFPILLATLWLLLDPASGGAQSLTSGDIAGVIQDTSGAVVPVYGRA